MGSDQVSEYEQGVPAQVETEAVGASPSSLLAEQEASGAGANEFVWLFEFGLEMDSAFLNARERLHSTALLYGPGVLKGYRIAFDALGPHGEVAATIVSGHEYGAEVWGMLYRIPRRLTEPDGDEPPLLDTVHAMPYFESRQVLVYEPYRKRELLCITYVASAQAQQQFRLLSPEQQVVAASYVKQLIDIASQHGLPDRYLQKLRVQGLRLPPSNSRSGAAVAPRCIEGAPLTGTRRMQALEQQTEPLSAVGKGEVPLRMQSRELCGPAQAVTKAVQDTTYSVNQSRWLMAFAFYLLTLLLAVLVLAIMQGLGAGNALLAASFAPLSIPWMVLVYGVLGGCVSSLITLGRRRVECRFIGTSVACPPGFVVVTWFARPYIGAFLAALAYLALNSGIFVLNAGGNRYAALFSLVGALAGMCAGWIFR